MEIGEFHWKNGRYFKRLDDGSVRMRWAPGPEDAANVHVEVIPAAEWASIIAHVSAKGETAESYAAAEVFHG